MKKIKLEFRKKVISTLSGNDLVQIRGGNTAFSYNSCPSVDHYCQATGKCTDKDSVQTVCLLESKNCITKECLGPVNPVDPFDPGTCGCATYSECKTADNCIKL